MLSTSQYRLLAGAVHAQKHSEEVEPATRIQTLKGTTDAAAQTV